VPRVGGLELASPRREPAHTQGGACWPNGAAGPNGGEPPDARTRGQREEKAPPHIAVRLDLHSVGTAGFDAPACEAGGAGLSPASGAKAP